MYPYGPFAHPTGSFNAPVTPPDVDPDNDPQVTIRVSSKWLPYIRGSLSQLLLQSTWKVDSLDDYEIIIGRVRDLLRIVSDENVENCDCLEFDDGGWKKFVPDGIGGGSFQPVDPRSEGNFPPPWITPPSGQTGNCLTAGNIVSTLKAMTKRYGDILDEEAGFATGLVAIEAYLALALPLIGEVIEIATAMAAAAIDAGATLFGATFFGSGSSDVFDALTCAISCFANSDGSVTQTELDDAYAKWSGELDSLGITDPGLTLWRYWVQSFFNGNGPNGMTALGNKGGLVTADCDSCNCGWQSIFDFTTDDYSSLLTGLTGTWADGIGYTSAYGGSSFSCSVLSLELLLGAAVDITFASADYSIDAPGFSGANSENVFFASGVGLYGGNGPFDVGPSLHKAQGGTIHALTTFGLQINTGDSCALSHCSRLLVQGNGDKPAGWP